MSKTFCDCGRSGSTLPGFDAAVLSPIGRRMFEVTNHPAPYTNLEYHAAVGLVTPTESPELVARAADKLFIKAQADAAEARAAFDEADDAWQQAVRELAIVEREPSITYIDRGGGYRTVDPRDKKKIGKLRRAAAAAEDAREDAYRQLVRANQHVNDTAARAKAKANA